MNVVMLSPKLKVKERIVPKREHLTLEYLRDMAEYEQAYLEAIVFNKTRKLAHNSNPSMLEHRWELLAALRLL